MTATGGFKSNGGNGITQVGWNNQTNINIINTANNNEDTARVVRNLANTNLKDIYVIGGNNSNNNTHRQVNKIQPSAISELSIP